MRSGGARAPSKPLILRPCPTSRVEFPIQLVGQHLLLHTFFGFCHTNLIACHTNIRKILNFCGLEIIVLTHSYVMQRFLAVKRPVFNKLAQSSSVGIMFSPPMRGSKISAMGGRQGIDDIWDGDERFFTYTNTDLPHIKMCIVILCLNVKTARH